MRPVRMTPRPAHRGAVRKAVNGQAPVRSYSTAALAGRQSVLRLNGRVVAKLVLARPLGELVLAQPYRHRPMVTTVSQHPVVLAYASHAGARLWVVRDDRAGRCWAIDLAAVERVGWLRRHRDGWPEVFVPLSAFRQVGWQEWPFVVEPVIDLDEPAEPPAVQLALPGLEVRR